MTKKINVMEFDLEPMDLPNILATYKKGVDRLPIKMTETLRQVAYEVAKKFPNWKLVTDRLMNHETYLKVLSFNVFCNDEFIGEFRHGWYSGDDAIEVKNERISKARRRGDSALTKDPKKAVKIIAKNFGARTVWENLEEAIDDIQDRSGILHRHDHYQLDRSKGQIFSYLETHILKHWDTQYAELAKQNGMKDTDIDGFKESLERYEFSKGVRECMERNGGAVVLILGNEYCVSKVRDPSKAMRIFTTETLPNEIKAAVGMLKLVEDNRFVGNVGFRYKEDKFFIVVEDEVWLTTASANQ